MLMRTIFDELNSRIREKADITLYVVHDYEDKFRLSRLLDKRKYKVVTFIDVAYNGIVGLSYKEYKTLDREEVHNLIKKLEKKEYVIDE